MHNKTFLDEKDMLLSVANGNEEAFEQLFSLHHHQLGIYIYHLTDSMELAEEVVQDVFLKIWISRGELAGIKNFKGYLFVISKNHALNCLRKVARERLHYEQWDDSVIDMMALSENERNTKYYDLLDEAIDNLPVQQKKVYLLSRHQRLKYSEISENLDLSKETVKKYLKIAVTSIKNHIQTNIDASILFIVILLNL
ncbi:sigma-70 family RNA polymerase sigma factor [Mucilaginibacter sp.]|uniref:RNA polymerase sigma factor n=1 Tax=Mucilaginibacter sp. TaxID=1882438 RepID=UPI00261570BF|nr:sigma-70 family RNA polymerase sigma factor [Mucilaginibacter sp.]MDB5029859.1 polymerase sigma-70 factor [Mucilaginibacter sp.]